MPFLATGFVPWLTRRTFRGGAVGEPGTIPWDGEPETLVEVTDSADLTVCFNNGTWLAVFGEGDDRVEALVYVDAARALHFGVRRRDVSTGTWTWAEQATSADVPPIDPTKTLPPTLSKAAITIHQEVSTYAYGCSPPLPRLRRPGPGLGPRRRYGNAPDAPGVRRREARRSAG